MKQSIYQVKFVDVHEVSFLSENIVFYRRKINLTQEQCAQLIGIKRSLLGAYEEGRAEPSIRTLIRMSKVFGKTIDQLIRKRIEGEEEKESEDMLNLSEDFLRKISLMKYLVEDIELCAKVSTMKK